MKLSLLLSILILAALPQLAYSRTSVLSTMVQTAVTSSSDYFGNLYVYYTWNTSFIMCALWGFAWILFTADRGLAYSTCMANYQSTFVMN